MNTTELLRSLQAARIRLAVKDGKLSVDAPRGALTAELREELTARKSELIALLSETKPQQQVREPIPRADRSAPLPLSFAQQRIWFLEELEGGSSVYNIPWAMRVRGPLDPQALQRALNDLAARHESLRTTFAQTDAGPVQIVAETGTLPLERMTLPAASAAEVRQQVETWARLRFDLRTGPLLHAGLIATGRDEWVLALVIHHIVSDGWSLDILQSELFSLYAGHVSGTPVSLSELPLQLADYAAWQRSQAGSAALEQQLNYWREQLRGAPPVIELPTDRPRPSEQSYRGSHVRHALPGDLSRQLAELAGERNVTLFMLLLAAFHVLLARYSGQDDIVVGTPVAGRQRTELEGLIGLFLNTLAIRADLSADPSFADLLQQIQARSLDAFEHQDLPFDRIVEALDTTRDLSHSPVFQVQFILQNAPTGGQPLPGLQFAPLEFDYGTAKFDLTLAVAETGQGLAAEVEYATDLFARDTIERLLQHYERLLSAVVSNPTLPCSRLTLLSAAERSELLTGLHSTAVKYPADATLQSLLEEQAARTPAATALKVAHEATELSYAELNARANQLAHWLRAAGVGPGCNVGVYMERSTAMVVALLGIVKAGGAYVPLDPDYPQQRLRHILEDATIELILGQEALGQPLDDSSARVVAVDQLTTELARQPADNPVPLAQPNDVAYVIFTSGSTGRPKGVMNEHRGICNRLLWMQDEYGLDATDRILQKTPFSFDVSVWEFFWPLLSGATLVMARPGGHKDSDYLCDTIRRHNITTLHFVPSMLQVFLQNTAARDCGSLRRVICSGEALSHDLQTRFYLTLDAGLHNLYGPTEAAIDVTYWACPRDSRDTTVPIGHPVANTHIYIVEPNGEPAPLGVAGELWIGGVQVARGYAGRPDLTAERFIPDPFSAAPDARVYRTGDLARLRRDGAVEFLGRIDQQVKLRGFRIELGEIEATLDAQPSVEQSLVVLREDVPGNKRLVAYLTPHRKAAPDVPELRNALQASLPEYMVPAAFVVLDAFPLLPNGKVDRRALPEPAGTREVGSDYTPPGTPVETALATIWSELLRIDRVGIHDNFFELGGDSILSIQIITRAAREGIHLQPKQVFRYQTIAELAEVAGTGPVSAAEQGLVTGTVPLTPVQHWFFAQGDVQWDHFNQSIRLTVQQPLAAALLADALRGLVRHHDALRLRFEEHAGSWQAHIAGPADHELLTTIDTSDCGDAEREARVLEAANAVQGSLDIGSGCLLRALYCMDAQRPAELIIVVHHLGMDGLSWRILLEDLTTLCSRPDGGAAAELPPKTSSVKDWAEALLEYARSPGLTEQLDYWRAAAQPAAPPPLDHPDGANTVASTASATLQLSPAQTRRLLQDAPRAYRTQINDLLLVAFAESWRRWCGQTEVVIDLEGHGREEVFPQLDVGRTIGWFTSIFPVRLTARPESLAVAIKQTKEQLRATPERGFGFGPLRYLAGAPELAEQRSPVLFNYLGQFDQSFSADGLFAMSSAPRGAELGAARERSHVLEVNGGVYDGALSIALNYSSHLHTAEQIAELASHFETALLEVLEHCTSGAHMGYTPSDFPLAQLDQPAIDTLMAEHPSLDDIYPVTPMQHGMLFHSLLSAASADHLSQVYLTQVLWELQGELDPDAFRAAWQVVTDRHASLRTLFVQSDYDQPLAIVITDAPVELDYADWREFTAETVGAELDALIRADRENSFDLTRAPLMRLFLRRTADQTYKFLWSHHHAIMDGWSIPVVLDELFAAYASRVADTALELPVARRYGDYIAWLQAQDAVAAETYWRQALSGFTAPTPLPGATQAYRGTQQDSAYAKAFATLTPAQTSGLRQVAKQLRLTLNSLAQGVWALLLSRYTGERDVLFGATTSGRPAELKHVESMVGLFLNTIPVRAELRPELTAREWLAALQEEQLAARQHEYAALTDVQGWSDVPRGTSLFNTLLIFENYPDVSALWEDRNALRVTDMQALGWTSFPLSAAVSVGNQLILRLAYDTSCYDSATIQQLSELYCATLTALIEQPEVRLNELLQVAAPARRDARPRPGPTNAYAPIPVTALADSLVARFEAQVEQTPTAPAVQTAGAAPVLWSYAELNQRANAVAHALLRLGVEPGSRIGLVLGHDEVMLAGLMGSLKAGCAYVPLDPNTPAARLHKIIAEAGIATLVHAPEYTQFAAHLAETSPQTALTLVDAAQPVDAALENPGLAIPADALAYILFTSGSTGTPKGVMQLHRNVGHHARTYVDALHIAATDRLSLISPYGFDAAVMDIYGALLTGACLCPLDMKRIESAAAGRHCVAELGVTIFHATPTVFRFLFGEHEASRFEHVRLVVLGGEEARPGDLQLFKECFTTDALFVNGLGPTESTLALQYFADHHTPIPPAALPVGSAVAGTEVLLLDQDGNEAALDGEICIRSAFVTPGYWNAPELNNAAFTTDDKGRRIYRTGDLGRYDIDGQLIFIGRRDAQIKVRGHRIEPGEIESAILTSGAIDRCVVVLMHDDAGEPRLTAYCVAPAETLDAAALRRHVQERLPDYMVPSAFVAIDAIPLTPNGKLDRRALPTPEITSAPDTYVAPESPAEQRIAELWAAVLRVERVGRHDDFFALGGHSLIATQLMSRLRDELGVELPLAALFDHPTVAGIAAAAAGSATGASAGVRPRSAGINELPLSFSQQRLWFLDQLDPGSTVYVISWANRMATPVNPTALQQAINDLVARHESLRTHFRSTPQGPVQVIEPELEVNLQQVTATNREALPELLTELSAQPFDLGHGPLLRITLVQLADATQALHIAIHHIVSDNWSNQLLMEELLSCYAARSVGQTPQLTPLPVQYGDFALWQQEQLVGPVLQRQLKFWTETLRGAPLALNLPTDRPRPLLQSFNGAHRAWELSDGTGTKLRQLAGSAGASMFMALFAAFAVLLGRYTGERDFLVGTPIAGRRQTELERLIGFFVNTLVMRADLDGEPTFRQLLKRVRTATLAAFEHQDLPFEKLVEELQPERDQSRSPLFQVAFIVQNAPQAELGGDALLGDALLVEHSNSKFDLTLGMWEADGRLGGSFEYNTDLFDASTIDALSQHFTRLLQGLTAEPDRSIFAVPLLSAREEQMLLADWNATTTAWPDAATLPDWFAQSAATYADKTAVEFGAQTVTYAELDALANRLAQRLVALGAAPDNPIALCAERGIELVIGIVGILKSGAAYVALDPAYPRDRIDYMLTDSGAELLVTTTDLQAELALPAAHTIVIDPRLPVSASAAAAPAIATSPGDLAYLIYTSGSTGKPKGVQIEHRSAINFLHAMSAEPGLTNADRLLAVTTPCFDISVLELLGPLTVGATVVVASRAATTDGLALQALLQQDISVMQATPATWRLLLATDWAGTAGLRVLCGGEALEYGLGVQLLDRAAEVWNMYGPTEATVWSSCARFTHDMQTIHVGRPINNTQYYVLDDGLRPVPRGVAGELYIGGAGVARGYRERPELNTEKFPADPFSDDPAARLYRTGDLARYTPDGNLQILGRTDFQVKLRGFRIELGEIEAALLEQPGVDQAVVVLREDTPGNKQLAGYVTGTTPPAAAELRTALQALLPDYMVPAALLQLEDLPLTPNGKVDRQALPAPEPTATAAYVAPRNETEEILAEIWADILNTPQVGIHDDFFALGGHSLLAAQVVARIRETLNADIPLRMLFDTPSVAALTPAIATAARETLPPPVVARSRAERLPLSFAQQRQWLLAELDSNSAAYNIPLALRLTGALNRAALQSAIDGLVARHEVLRTRFATADGKPYQVICAEQPVLVQHEVCPEADVAQLRNRVQQLADTVMDLRTGPLLNVHCLQLHDQEHVLVLVINHIAADQWALGLLLGELAELYSAGCENRPAVLPQLPVQYADYALWQHEWLNDERISTELAYWQQQLAGAPAAIGLATDRPRPPQQTFAGDHVHAALDQQVAAGVRALARETGSTLFMVMLAAFNGLLQRYSGDDDIVIGTPVSGRSQTQLENVVGMFLNTLVIRTDLTGEPTFKELLGRVKQVVLDAYAHQDLPFERLVEELQPERDMSRTPLFQVLFTMQQIADDALPMHGLDVESAKFDFAVSKFDIAVFVANDGSDLALDFGYNTDLYERSTIEQMVRHFQRVLTAVATDPGLKISQVALLEPAEERRMLQHCSGPERAFPATLVHELVAATAARIPGQPAIQFGNISVSYAGLNARANRLARHLRESGAGPDQLVAIAMPRSIEQVVAVLAILKTGAGYVPVDPNYPASRQAAMLADSGATVVLTSAELADDFDESVTAIALDKFNWQEGDGTDFSTACGATVYVIYTSGSTGTPKGVELTHRGLNNLLQWQLQQPGLDSPARTLQFASLSFDVSFQEMFSTWAQGGTLVLIAEERRRDMRELARLVADAGIERLFLPFAALQPLAEELSAGQASRLQLRDIVVAGEQLQITPAIRQLFGALGDARLHNHYGPTETHVVTAHTLAGAPADWPALPLIGRPVANTRAYVLDPHGQPVPPGAPGELYIGGVQVATGYLHRAELTAARFTADRFHAGARMYATGDRVRVTATGELQYLGRTDAQIKWRGFRIEPGEIESVLSDNPAVRQAVVVLREDRPGDKRLVAYIVPTGAPPDSAALQATLREQLPEHMVPSLVMPVPELPLTPSGKIARRSLPVPDYTETGSDYVAPRNRIETVLCEIWADVLGVSRVGIHDDFFQLGGHSLLATQVIARVRDRLTAQVELRSLFNAPTIAGFAAVLGSAEEHSTASGGSRIMATPHSAGAPLSFAQQRLWFLDRMGETDAAVYNIPGAVRLRGHLNKEALQAAVNKLVQRHETLRTVFVEHGGEPVQLVREDLQVELEVERLSGASEADLRRVISDTAARGFNLATGPLLRVYLYELSPDDHVLAMVMHHIISDGWSIDVLNADIAELYAAELEHRPPKLPELTIQYADYAIWQREELTGTLLDTQVDYWRNTLAGAPAVLELPTDRARPAVQTYSGACHHDIVARETLEQLQALAAENGATLFMALLAAFNELIARYSGEEDIVVGSPIAGRQRTEVESLIGFFVNTLVLRNDVSGAPSFRELLARTRVTTLGAYDHQDVPFERIVEELQPARSMAHTPLFQIMFVLQRSLGSGFGFAGLEAGGVDFELTTAKFDLLLSAQETEAGLITGFTYNTDLFDAATIARVAEQFRHLLEGIVAQPDTPLRELSLLDPPARQLLLTEWNNTSTDYPHEATLAEVFAQQVTKTPTAIAVRCGAATLTYAELNERANRLAHYLVATGVEPDTLVAFSLERSITAVETVLAVLKAGCAYVPLDPAYPESRLQFMLADTSSPVLLTESTVNPDLSLGTCRRINLDELSTALADQPVDAPTVPGSGESLAYVIYTSGSTGQPKGTLIEQRSVLRLVINNHYAPLERGLNIGMLAPMSFDASTLELWGSLLHGGCCVVLPGRNPGLEELREFFAAHELDLLWLTATLFNTIIDAAPEILADVGIIMTGGEALSIAHMRRASSLLPDTQLINGYGPTESTTFTTTFALPKQQPHWRSVPIGKPIANTRLYILDAQLNPVPVGITGELYIGGDGLARGYLNRPELTAERFVASPFSPAERLYKTGDRVRYLADGNVEFVGRVDEQIKLRGFRIELGEIEAALRSCPGVVNAAVTLHAVSTDDRRLIAYAVAENPAAAPEPKTLQQQLSDELPAYMVPAMVMLVPEIPRTANGKLDRKALPEPAWATTSHYVGPTTELQSLLCEIWEEILSTTRVGVQDDFFALGGHSLLIIRMINRVEQATGCKLRIATVFAHPTVEQLARQIELDDTAARSTARIQPVEHNAGAPLSFSQQRLWFLDQMSPAGATAYNVPGAIRLHGELDAAALQQAIDRLVARHESLRTIFAATDAGPVQRILPALHIPLAQTAAREMDVAELRSTVIKLANVRFDLAHGPLLQAHLLATGEQEHVLVIVLHHIIADGWSIDILYAELAELYAAARDGRTATLAELPVQYADFAIWQRNQLTGSLLQEQLRYWRDQLAGAPQLLELPTDFARPTVQTYSGGVERGWIPRHKLDALQELAGEQQATLFMALLTVFNALLSRYAGQDDVVVGSPIAGRPSADVEGLIGFFVNTLVLRTDLAGAPSFNELLARTRATTLAAYQHQDVPFEKLVEELQPERNMAHAPLFQVMFVLQQRQDQQAGFAGLDVESVEFEMTTAKFDVILSAQEMADGLLTGFNYNTDLFRPSTIARLTTHFERLLDAILAQPDAPLAELPLLDVAEQTRLVEEWNATRADYPRDNTLADVFATQAAATPERIAIRTDSAALTYAELNCRANQLAHVLRARGVHEGEAVALCFDRGLDAVLSIIAIIKAGAAYVPLDPAYPDARLQFMLEDTDSRLLLSRSDMRADLPVGSTARLDLDTLSDELAAAPDVNPRLDVDATTLAYVIYTSGSTGRPKGTLIEHRSVLRLVKNTDYAPLEEGLAVAMLAPMSFDASTLEIWGPLLNGGEAVIFTAATPGIAELQAYFGTHRIDLLFVTTSLFNSIIDEAPAMLRGIRYLLTGGEAMSISHIDRATRLLPDTRLSNVYGPTESTTFATHYPLADSARDWRTVPIGKPIRNTTLFVLDERLQPVPVGVAGELYIGGDGLARGYLNLPELTAARFVANPFGPRGTRLYKTGDQVRLLEDGNVEFLGRIDEQVKLRGFRIELGEVEAALCTYPGITNAAALVHTVSERDKRLVAYCVAEITAGDAIDEQAVLTYLSEQLPGYMVPSAIIALDSLPTTINGKLDKAALPEPSWASTEAYAPPQTELEQTLCELWQEALKVERVGVNDDFFALGGHSLLIISLLNRIKGELGLQLEIATVFENPTVAGLARQLERTTPAARAADSSGATSVLMPIRTSGSRAPLFCIHGEPLKMAQVLDAEQPLYGIYFSYDPDFRMPNSLEALATLYLRELRRIQPRGPYHIVGYCLGGLAAFEMARQLHAAGEEIAYLALIDPTDPGRVVTRTEWVKSAFAIKGQRLNAARYFALRACKSVYARTQHAGRILKTYLYQLAGREIPFILREVRHTGKARSSFSTYRYQPVPLQGVLFRPDLGAAAVTELEQYWGTIFANGAEFITVPGLTNHHQFMQEPFHSDVSAMIDDQLRERAAAETDRE